jgi:hypothetical protein
MLKRVILTALFFILTTGLFGVFNAPAVAQSCTTTGEWPGICVLQTECNESNDNIAWDQTKCGDTSSPHDGCCGVKPGAPENMRPGLGQNCKTTKGWPGTCTKNIDCDQSKPGVVFDVTTCKAGGCCGINANVTPTTKICDFAGDKQPDCEICMGNGTAAWTALGCIQTDPQKFIGSILGIAIGIGGGIAFLLILFGGFQILMSAGNPEKLNAGKELITSAITGLLIIIFSIFILQLIGVTIFAIPGFK